MFEENNTLVTDEVTENTELTVEENELVEESDTETIEQSDVEEVTEQPRMYTEAEVEEIKTTIKLNAKKNAERKLRREYENKYSRLETVVNTGLGTSNVEESTQKLEEFYKKRGINIPSTPVYTERETELIANGEAQDIISAGYDEVCEEVDRLAEIGVENMTQRDKILFTKLAKYRTEVEQENDLRSLGISKEEIDNQDFKDFTSKLNPDLSLKEKYELYSQVKPKKEIRQIGSVKSGMTNQVKDQYTQEEIAKLSLDDLDNPEVWDAVRKSMTNQN